MRAILLSFVASIFGFHAVSPALAKDYPSRPVRILVGFQPGGSTDVLAHVLGSWLTERLGQPLLIENRPGAATNIATEAALRAPADGHTLLTISSTSTINATLYDRLGFNFVRDVPPIAIIVRVPIVLEVNPSVPAKSIPEFISYVKANPGKVNLATPGNGTPAHVASELFKLETGLDMIHVPYRGDAPGLTDLLGGRVQAMFTGLPTFWGTSNPAGCASWGWRARRA